MRQSARNFTNQRTGFRIHPALIVGGVLLLTLGGLWAAKVVTPATFGFGPKPLDRRGMVAIPVSTVRIPAYTRVTRDQLWDTTTGSFKVIYLAPQQVSPEITRGLGQIIGRVVSHDKTPGYAFTEADFLPPGTRPGLTAGIPAGKRAIRVAADKIQGVFGLEPGDRFDLISTIPIDGAGGTGAMGGGIYSQQLELQARLSNWKKQATVRVLVQNGHIVEPVTLRNVPVTTNTLTNGMQVRTKPVQEVVLAVEPGEIASLAEAMVVGADITCIPRSGRPDDPVDSVTPGLSAWSPYGGTVPAPSRSNAPVAASGGDGQQPNQPSSGAFGPGPFTTIETITGTNRQIVAAPVKH